MASNAGNEAGKHIRALTQTEHRVARLAASGRTSAEMAAELGLTPKSVEWHLSRVSRKLGAPSQQARQTNDHANNQRRYS